MSVEKSGTKTKIEGQLRNLFGNKQRGSAELIGTADMGEQEVWRLEPCMLHAASSGKMIAFAVGTTATVGA